MSLATELLFNTSRRRSSTSDADDGTGATASWPELNRLVYSLLDKHEPDPHTEAALRSDMRMMQLSGLVDELSPCSTRRVCKEASDVMAELLRLLPRSK